MYGWHQEGFGWMGGLLALAAVVVFWGGVVALAILLFRHFGAASPSSSARRILDERFARGEIDAEEYAERRSRLGK